jgi:hypothetical protein
MRRDGPYAYENIAIVDIRVFVWVPSPTTEPWFTIRRRTYQVRVECGREFEYSREGMHSMRSSDAKNVDAPPNTVRQAEASAT